MAKLNKNLGKLGLGAGALAFAYSATSADVSAIMNSTTGPLQPFGNKLQAWAYAFIGRLTGKIPAGGNTVWYPGAQSTGFGNWSFGKALNNVFWAGLGATIYGHLPFRLPMKSAARRLGTPVMVGAFIGGGLDPSSPTRNPSGNVTLPQLPSPTAYSAPARGAVSQGGLPY